MVQNVKDKKRVYKHKVGNILKNVIFMEISNTFIKPETSENG